MQIVSDSCRFFMKEIPESEIQAKFLADTGEKRSEILAEKFRGFSHFKFPGGLAARKCHEKPSTFSHDGRNKILSLRDSGSGGGGRQDSPLLLEKGTCRFAQKTADLRRSCRNAAGNGRKTAGTQRKPQRVICPFWFVPQNVTLSKEGYSWGGGEDIFFEPCNLRKSNNGEAWLLTVRNLLLAVCSDTHFPQRSQYGGGVVKQ